MVIKVMGVMTFLAVCEMAWLLAIWLRTRHWRRECDRRDARLALATAHIIRLAGAAEELLRQGDFANGVTMGHGHPDEGEVLASSLVDRFVTPARAFLDKAHRTWLHQKRGTRYHVLDHKVRLNCSGPVHDGDDMYLYVDVETGKLSVRRDSEFTDGRFILLREDGTWGGDAGPAAGL